MFHDMQDGGGCRRLDKSSDPLEYTKAYPIEIPGEDQSCTVKYHLNNTNTVHDLRV